MIVVKNKADCCGCSACVNICAKKCIGMVEDEEGFLYPRADTERCVNCTLCEKVCPVTQNINREKADAPACSSAFAVKLKDADSRLHSTSGGAFSAIAKEIIEKKGVVFGATFSNGVKSVVHTEVQDASSLGKIIGTKYVQSDCTDSYKSVKDYLTQGRYVLFVGVPCQIAGLKNYLGCEYDNLYTVDLICHGVPSPGIWAEYIKTKEDKRNSRIKSVNFRDKSTARSSAVSYRYEDNTAEICPASEDTYMRGYLSNVFVRPSCFNCRFKGENRFSDITLGDCWGLQNINPAFYDKKGISLLLPHSEKGLRLWNEISRACEFELVEKDQILKYNRSYYESAAVSKYRRDFFALREKCTTKKALTKYCKIGILEKGKKKFKSILRRFLKSG